MTSSSKKSTEDAFRLVLGEQRKFTMSCKYLKNKISFCTVKQAWKYVKIEEHENEEKEEEEEEEEEEEQQQQH